MRRISLSGTLRQKSDHEIPARTKDLVLIKKERTCRQVNFDIQTNHWGKTKDSENIDKYLDLGWEQNKGCGRLEWRWYQL